MLPGDDESHGPHADAAARHPTVRPRALPGPAGCGTCHDASNPVTGGDTLRTQAVARSSAARNGLCASREAHDIAIR